MLTMKQPDTGIVTLLAPSGGATKDVPMQIAGLVVVPIITAAEGALFSAYTRGVFKVPKSTAAAMVAGHWVKWDKSAANCTLIATAADDFNLGRVRSAVADTATEVEIIIEDRLRRSVNVILPIADVAAVADSAVKAAPFAGRITRFWSQLQGGAINGDAVVTGKIGATAITTGVLTLTASGSAAGDIDTAYPTALNIVAAGDLLVCSSDGGGSTSRAVDAYMEIEEL